MSKGKLFQNCPICNHSGIRNLAKATTQIINSPSQIRASDRKYGLHGSLSRCLNCQFVFVNDRSYVRKTVNFYKQMTDNDYLREEKHRSKGFNRLLNTLNKLRSFKKGSILDIGCNTGGLLNEAQKTGWSASGIDPSDWACILAKKRYGLTVHNSAFEKFEFPAKSFNTVTLTDVLEHVQNPRQVMIKINKILTDDGIVCLVTPDYGSLAAKLLKNRWWGIRRAHLSYFLYPVLLNLFYQTGFRVIKKGYYVRFLSLNYLLIRIFPVLKKFEKVSIITKNISIPLYLFDTFEIYLQKNL